MEKDLGMLLASNPLLSERKEERTAKTGPPCDYQQRQLADWPFFCLTSAGPRGLLPCQPLPGLDPETLELPHQFFLPSSAHQLEKLSVSNPTLTEQFEVNRENTIVKMPGNTPL